MGVDSALSLIRRRAMSGRFLVLFLLAAGIPSASVLAGCGGERESTVATPAAEVAAPSPDPFPGSYRAKGLTTDVIHGDTRRIQGIIVLTEAEGVYSTKADLETKYPSAGGPVDAQVIGIGTGQRSGDRLQGTTETQLVMSTVPGVDTGFAWVPRTVGPRLVSSWEARFRKDGTLVVDIRNEPAEGVEYSPTETILYGTRIEEPEAAE
jgi:hypothetical protein